jgi:hypothetical protein
METRYLWMALMGRNQRSRPLSFHPEHTKDPPKIFFDDRKLLSELG